MYVGWQTRERKVPKSLKHPSTSWQKIVEPRIGSKSQCTSVLTGYTITADQGLNIVAFATNNSFENPNAYFENKLSDARSSGYAVKKSLSQIAVMRTQMATLKIKLSGARISGYAVKKSYCKKNEMFGSILN